MNQVKQNQESKILKLIFSFILPQIATAYLIFLTISIESTPYKLNLQFCPSFITPLLNYQRYRPFLPIILLFCLGRWRRAIATSTIVWGRILVGQLHNKECRTYYDKALMGFSVSFLLTLIVIIAICIDLWDRFYSDRKRQESIEKQQKKEELEQFIKRVLNGEF